MHQRCLIITYYFPPLGGGGVQRISKLAKYLALLGWDISIITATEKNNIIPDDPALLDQLPSTFDIIRIPGIKLPAPKSSKINRSSFLKRWISAFIYIPDIRKKWIPQLRQAVNNQLKQKKFDCIILSIPPYSIGQYAVELSRTVDTPVILDMRDPWTLNPYKIHPTPLHRLIDRWTEFRVIKNISCGSSAYSSLIDYYSKKIRHFDKSCWHFAPNGFDEPDFADLQPTQLEQGFFNIGFSGTFYSHINNPRPFFRAIAWLKEKKPEIAAKIRFHHIGKSMISIEKTAKKFGIESCVKSWGYQSHKDCLNILSGMDALLFILDDNEHRSKYTIGGKVYEYLRLKKPILAMVPAGGEAGTLIELTDSGLVIPGNKTGKLALTIEKWIDGKMDFTFRSIEQYNRKLLAEKYQEFLVRLIENHDKTK